MEQLREMQRLPFEAKIALAENRIWEWEREFCGSTVVSFSGGKDSTVLLNLVRRINPDIRAVFSDTGLEYPEIRAFVKRQTNVDIVKPKMRFDEVISTYGYPLIGKEVAEAIYYARRIRSQNGKVERERERERERRQRQLLGGEERNPWTAGRMEAPRTGGGALPHFIKTSGARNRRTILAGLYPAGVNGKTGEGGAFSADGTLGGSSMFNKKKYLPLATDIPVPISHYCCQVMKKSPMKIYQRQNGVKPYLGTLAEESRLRAQAWVRHGCNAFDSKNPMSQPLVAWTEQDILRYIVERGIEIAPVYGDIVSVDEDGNEYAAGSMLGGCEGPLKCTGCDRTGCIFCGFGFHLEKGETRFQRLARTHPRQYEYAIGGGQWVDNPRHDPTAPAMDGEWKNWNPPKIWVPSKQGLGLGKVFDMVNELYGKDFYRYE